MDRQKLSKILGSFVLEKRIEMNISQRILAKRAGVSRTVVFNLETSLTSVSFKTLYDVFHKGLEVPFSELDSYLKKELEND